MGIAGTSYMAFCDSDGNFTISGVPAGTQKLSVYIDGIYKAFDDTYTVSEGTTASAGTIAVTRSTSASSNATNYVTCTATDNGIRFGVYISNNQSVLTTTTTTSSTSNTTTTKTSSRVSSNYDLSITDTDNNIVMDKTFDITNTYGITVYYPLVTKGKVYNFTVQCKYDGYIYFTESFPVTATGGLGELKVSNADELEPKLDTVTKTASRTAEVLDASSFTGTIQRKGTYYQVGRGTDWSDTENYWIIDGIRWSYNTTDTEMQQTI